MEETNIRYGAAQHTDVLHMTGGLRSFKDNAGWLIAPLPGDVERRHVGPIPDVLVVETCKMLGVLPFGADEVNESEPLLPVRVWNPFTGQPPLDNQPADTWAWVAHSGGRRATTIMLRSLGTHRSASERRP
jgi:hypothetical protein